MKAEEFVLIPKTQFIRGDTNPVNAILSNQNFSQKSKPLSLLQRLKKPEPAEESTQTKPETSTQQVQTDEVMWKTKLMQQLQSLKEHQLAKSKQILTEIEQSNNVGINQNGQILYKDHLTKIPLSSFLYNLQQPNKRLENEYYKKILEEINIPEHLTANQQAKAILSSLQTQTSDISNNVELLSDDEAKAWETF